MMEGKLVIFRLELANGTGKSFVVQDGDAFLSTTADMSFGAWPLLGIDSYAPVLMKDGIICYDGRKEKARDGPCFFLLEKYISTWHGARVTLTLFLTDPTISEVSVWFELREH